MELQWKKGDKATWHTYSGFKVPVQVISSRIAHTFRHGQQELVRFRVLETVADIAPREGAIMDDGASSLQRVED